jgi:hypothetical protein
MNRQTAVAIALLSAACAPVMRAQNVHTVSRNTADPTERNLVWARALEYFQAACIPVELSDPAGGILVSKDISNEYECRSLGRCQCIGSTQFTIAEDGTAMISRNCIVTAPTFDNKPLVRSLDVDRFREAQDHALLIIVGGAPHAPTPRRGNAQRGEQCTADRDCIPGYVCPNGACIPAARRQ